VHSSSSFTVEASQQLGKRQGFRLRYQAVNPKRPIGSRNVRDAKMTKNNHGICRRQPIRHLMWEQWNPAIKRIGI
jgi:hypothetical protein